VSPNEELEGPATAEEQELLAEVPEAARPRLLRFLRSERVVRQGGAPPSPAAAQRAQERILGGREIPSTDFPSCCCLGGPDDAGRFTWFCSGVLIHERAVLTAAHCGRRITRVQAGSSHVLPDEDGHGVAAARVAVHPKYRPRTRVWNDLALVLLAEPAEAPVARIASAAQLAAAEEVDLVGFGFNDPTRPIGFGVKRHVRVAVGAVHADGQDLTALEHRYGFSAATEFVAGRKGLGKDTCRGDSGGPAYLEAAGAALVAGITSRATLLARVTCGDGGVYTRPDRYLDWILSVLDEAHLAP